MKPAPFGFAKARSVDDAIALMGQHADARLLAGGQSLIATLNMRLSAPTLLVDVNALDELKRISVKDGMVEIGALVRHAQAERSAEILKAKKFKKKTEAYQCYSKGRFPPGHVDAMAMRRPYFRRRPPAANPPSGSTRSRTRRSSASVSGSCSSSGVAGTGP